MRNGNRQQKRGWEKGNLFFSVYTVVVSLCHSRKKGAVEEEEEKTKCERGEV